MRIWIGAIFLFLLCGAALSAQSLPAWELSGGYTYVRANAPPGQCGCFSMNGGNGGIAYRFSDYFSVAADFAAVHNGNINGSNHGFTLTSYQFGPRIMVPLQNRLAPFAEVLVGGAHASGMSGNSSNAFAASVGGGMDWNLSRRFSLRLIQADYYLTRFPNGVNDHENNLRLSVGIVLHFGRD